MTDKFNTVRKIKLYCSICKKLRIVHTYYKDSYNEIMIEKELNKYICSDHIN